MARKKSGGKSSASSKGKDSEIEADFVIESIGEVTESNLGTPLFKVEWEGYPPDESTWEPLDTIIGLTGALAKRRDELLMQVPLKNLENLPPVLKANLSKPVQKRLSEGEGKPRRKMRKGMLPGGKASPTKLVSVDSSVASDVVEVPATSPRKQPVAISSSHSEEEEVAVVKAKHTVRSPQAASFKRECPPVHRRQSVAGLTPSSQYAKVKEWSDAGFLIVESVHPEYYDGCGEVAKIRRTDQPEGESLRIPIHKMRELGSSAERILLDFLLKKMSFKPRGV